MRTGLVLEGGAMRGMFTAGVMDVLMEQKIRFDGAIGVSAGAAFGVNYKSGQSALLSGCAILWSAFVPADGRSLQYRVLLWRGTACTRSVRFRRV